MSDLVSTVRARATDPETIKVVKYGMVSGVSVVVTLATLRIALHFDVRPWVAQSMASIAGAIPSYYLNRAWVWGKTGKSHMRKEVIPFWIMFAVGFFVAIGCVSIMDHFTTDLSKAWQDNLNTAASFLAYGGLWVIKYLIFNKFLFANHEEDLDPVLDGRSGIPT